MTGSWHQQGPGTGASTAGKVLAQPLTWVASQATVGAASSTIVAADATSNTRRITIFVPLTADTGITLNFGGGAAVAATHYFLPAGAVWEEDTLQAITAIRNGAADVTAYIQVGTA